MQQITGEHPCRSVISIKLQSNFIEITLRPGCSPINLLYIFRTLFTKNTYRWLLLTYIVLVLLLLLNKIKFRLINRNFLSNTTNKAILFFRNTKRAIDIYDVTMNKFYNYDTNESKIRFSVDLTNYQHIPMINMSQIFRKNFFFRNLSVLFYLATLLGLCSLGLNLKYISSMNISFSLNQK